MATPIVLPSFSFLRRVALARGVHAAEADDVAQDALLMIWQRWGELGPDDDVAAWMADVAARVARNHVKRARRKREVALADQDDIEDERENAERVADLLRVMRVLLGGVHPIRRGIYIEHDFVGRSVREIAEAQGISEATVRDRLEKAREEIRAAARRWELERERRGWAKLFALPAALWAMGPGAKAAAAVGIVVVVAAVGARRSEVPLLSHIPPDPVVLPAAPPHPSPAPEALGVLPAASVPAPHRWQPPTAREAELIERAGTALELGLPDEALRRLDDHAREFPNGALAPERRALRRRLP